MTKISFLLMFNPLQMSVTATETLTLEYLLNKKHTRHTPHNAVPTERVVAIKLNYRHSARSGLSWSPEVADFYLDIFPEMLERGLPVDSQLQDASFEELP